MKRFFNIFAIALASVLMFSCQKDADVDNFGLGGTVRGKFSLVVPSNELVEITRSEATESDVTNVTLFYFDNNHNALNVVDGKNYETIVLGNATTSGNYTRTYTVGTKAEFTDGQGVYVYAIANTDSSLGQVADFTAVASNFAQFEKLLMNLNSLNTPFSTLTMSGTLQCVASKQYGLTGTISVKRPYAKVNFTIKNGTDEYTFKPTEYAVYNVPTSSSVFEGVKASDVKFTKYEGMTDFVESQGSQLIEFYMLENEAGEAANVANYNDRELRKDVTGGAHSEFAHGLTNATYVVIKGEGKGENAKGEPISASVSYTIHLGDFAANAKDFNVKRNHFYNYTVTVNGVENIVVEAESESMDDDKFQHGAEGTVINLEGSKMVYTLDAHYEQVLLKLNLTSLPTGDDDVVMVVSSPFMDEDNKGKMITWKMIESADFAQKFDVSWVEFYAGNNKSGQNALCAYPTGNANLMKTVDFLKFVKGLATDGNTSNDQLSVVAFINEYFYNDNPLTGEKNIHWSEFVNKEDRTMRILQEPTISADGYSISTKALCSFTQRSIRTFFNENVENAYGMEWYDETGALSIFTPSSNNLYNDNSGYTAFSNNSWFVSRGTPTWTNFINVAAHGYTENGQPNGNSYNALKGDYAANAAYACLQRNRTMTDRKWYPAAPNQYVAYWYGEASMPNDAKLYQGNPAENFVGDYSQVSHYWTTGTTNKRVFWAIEGATLSQSATWAGSNSRQIRCLRNLGADNASAAATAEFNSNILNAPAIIIKNFKENAYRAISTQRLPVHHEREAANKLPKAFIVAKNNLTATWTAMSDAPAAPQILSAEVKDGSLVVKFLEKDTYVYAKSTSTNSMTNVVLGTENSVVINNPSGTYYFRTKRNFNTYSQYVTVAANGTINNTPAGNGGSYSINGGTSNNKIPLMAAIHQDICANYTSESANGTAWRVPNQRELLAIQLVSSELNNYLTNDVKTNTHSSTLFSARNVASTNNDGDLRYGFVWYHNGVEGFGMQRYDWGVGTASKDNGVGYVRCVRDASEAELEQLGLSNSGDQEDGGEA